MPTKKEIREYRRYLKEFKRKLKQDGLGLPDDYTATHKSKFLPSALSSNIQQKKNRGFLKKDLKRLGFEGPGCRASSCCALALSRRDKSCSLRSERARERESSAARSAVRSSYY